MTDDTNLLQKVFDQANYRAIFENQREKLIEVLKASLIYSYNGGFFQVGPAFFYELSMYIDEGKTEVVLLDINYNLVEIDDINEFLFEVKSVYFEAINTYKIEIERLKKTRYIPTITRLYELDDDVES